MIREGERPWKSVEGGRGKGKEAIVFTAITFITVNLNCKATKYQITRVSFPSKSIRTFSSPFKLVDINSATILALVIEPKSLETSPITSLTSLRLLSPLQSLRIFKINTIEKGEDEKVDHTIEPKMVEPNHNTVKTRTSNALHVSR